MPPKSKPATPLHYKIIASLIYFYASTIMTFVCIFNGNYSKYLPFGYTLGDLDAKIEAFDTSFETALMINTALLLLFALQVDIFHLHDIAYNHGTSIL
jgi:hypothetical protein